MTSMKRTWTIGEVGGGGERITHLYPNDCYYAHLSIYHFALALCEGKKVLDAGSGAGYGSAYLAKYGAQSVWGIDASQEAVLFSRDYFPLYNLNYQSMDLGDIRGFPDSFFDVIFSSNVLEHVVNIHQFLNRARTLLKADGTLFIAVPPITDRISIEANLAIPFHLNIWSPRQWKHTLSHYFEDVRFYSHRGARDDVVLNFMNSPQETRISEKDFVFAEEEAENISGIMDTITAIFIAKTPKPTINPLPKPVFIDESFSRLPPEVNQSEPAPAPEPDTSHAHYVAHLEQEVQTKNRHISELKSHIQRLESGKAIRLLNYLKSRF